MGEPLVRSQSAAEYFRELVEAALEHQHVTATGDTSFYVVNLLAGFVHPGHEASADDGEALGVQLARALQAAGLAQREALRHIGDVSLFTSGFFSDSLNRSLVDVDYYMELGARAYGTLARRRTSDTLGEVFDELAGNFGAFVDVLTEVSERSALSSNTDLLRLYEKWLRTGSRRSGDLLASRGIVPNPSIGSRFIQ